VAPFDPNQEHLRGEQRYGAVAASRFSEDRNFLIDEITIRTDGTCSSRLGGMTLRVRPEGADAGELLDQGDRESFRVEASESTGSRAVATANGLKPPTADS